MPDTNFEALLAAHNQEYADAEVYSSWLPPDGEYMVIVEKLDTGNATQDKGDDMLWWSLRCMIIDEGSFFKRKFSIFSSSKALGIFKGIVEAINSGEPVEGGLAEAHAVMVDAVGKVLKIESLATFSKKDKRTYTNISILEVLETSTVEETVADAPAEPEAAVESPVEGTPVEAGEAPATVEGG